MKSNNILESKKPITEEKMHPQNEAAKSQIPIKIASSLKSIAIVNQRLHKILERGQVSYLNEHQLYQLYCAGDYINENFFHLLDNDVIWFKQYFSHADAFLLASSLKHACISGNIELVKYLVEKKGAQLNSNLVNLAVAAGNLDLVKYLIETKKCDVEREKGINVFYYANISGNVDVLKYLITQYDYLPDQLNIYDHRLSLETAVCSGSLDMVKFLHETFHLSDDISIFAIEHSRNLNLIKYVVETLKWSPKGTYDSGNNELTEAAYAMGMLDVVKYVEEKFPCESLNSIALKNAIKSGNSDTFIHLLQKLNITTDFKNRIINANHYLWEAVESGNLDIVKFLVEKCGLEPTAYYLMERAVESQSIKMINYLKEHKHTITSNLFEKFCYNKNLELISMFYDQLAKSPWLNTFCMYEDTLLIVYDLITKKGYQPDQSMLDSAFFCYEFSRDNTMARAFIQYLSEVHHIKPSPSNIETLKKRNDHKLLDILLGNNEVNPVKKRKFSEHFFHRNESDVDVTAIEMTDSSFGKRRIR